jgi:hypothetical protein
VYAIGAVARDRASGDVRLGFAAGSWKERCTWDVTDGQASAPSIDVPELELQSIEEQDGKTLLTVNAPVIESQKSDVQLVVIANGTEVKSGVGVSKGAIYTFTYRCRLNQVTKVIARGRPFEWIEYKNVAFGPRTQPTSVAISNSVQASSMTR